jgi:hypothetical protein
MAVSGMKAQARPARAIREDRREVEEEAKRDEEVREVERAKVTKNSRRLKWGERVQRDKRLVSLAGRESLLRARTKSFVVRSRY